jgi:hypothetical protein
MKRHIAISALLVLIASTAFASNATTAFDKLKTLQGTWAGKMADGHQVQVTNRMVSGGSAMMSEIKGPENMITMIHLDRGRLLLTHYCSAGNQPRMVGTISPDGNTVTFKFLDATNLLPAQGGHMQSVVFHLIGQKQHTESWQFQATNGKQATEFLDLHRVD